MLVTKSWIAFLDTFVVAISALVVELLFVLFFIETLTITAVSITLAGAILLFFYRFIMKRKITIFSDRQLFWKYFMIGSIFFAVSEFAWYDSVTRLGAGQSVLLYSPLETVLIIVFALMFLNERLTKIAILGTVITMIGFFVSATNGKLPEFGYGDLEAIFGALLSAIAVTFYAKLLTRYHSIEVTAFSLLIGGLMLSSVQILYGPPKLDLGGWIYLIIFSLIPLFTFLLYYMSLSKIGASLTSVITAPSLVLTVVLQLILVRVLGVPMTLPENITLALIGGSVSVLGICLVFVRGGENNNIEQKEIKA